MAATVAARSYAKNRQKTASLLDAAERRASEGRGYAAGFLEELRELLRLLRAWVRGKYKVVPWKTLVLALAAVIYFVDPFDLVPDFLPIIGFTDDATVIAFVLRSIAKDITRFRDWEMRNARYGVATFND